MGLHRDVLKLLRSYELAKVESLGEEDVSWHIVEIEVIKRYMSWITKMKEQYATWLDHDRELLKLVEKLTPSGKYHWMYQFVLRYRIG